MLAREGKPDAAAADAAEARALRKAQAKAREATARLEAGGSLAPPGGVEVTPAGFAPPGADEPTRPSAPRRTAGRPPA